MKRPTIALAFLLHVGVLLSVTDFIDEIILFTVSFAANLFASVSGGGAGFVQFPLLILMGLPFAAALGTHKVAVVFLGLGALTKKFTNKSAFALDKQITLIMLLFGCPAVVAGSLIIIAVPAQIAEVILGLITIASGIYSLVKRQFGAQPLQQRSRTRVILGTLAIILIGLFSGSLSSGAGLFSTLSLVLIFGLELKRAILHTMVFVATLWNAVGAVTVGTVAEIYWPWVPLLIVATFTGSFVGTTLLIKLPVTIVRIIFSAVAILSGVTLIVAAF